MPVTVVLLTYNGEELLRSCLKSLEAQTTPPSRVLLVDNGSQPRVARKVLNDVDAHLRKRVELVELDENRGYVGGMNAGLSRALAEQTGDWVMTLSNDAELSPDFFERLEHVIRRAGPKLGMLAPKVRAMPDRDTLDGVGISVCLDGMSTARGQRELDRNQYDHDRRALLPNGVSALYRKQALRDAGLFDDAFWAYCEDTDLGLRCWLAGWDCEYVPECVTYHARSSTLGEFSLHKLYLVERNHYWVAIKNYPLPLLLLNPVFSLYRYLVQVYAVLKGQGQGKGYGQGYSTASLLLATAKGIAHATLGAPRAVARRMNVRAKRRRPYLEVLTTLWRERLRFSKLILK